MNETVVYLIRHSEITSKSNIKSINNSDSSQITNEKAFLSVSGEKKAEELSKLDELKNIDVVYSSNYVRALQTAKYIAQDNNTIINVDERLGERRIGTLGSMSGTEFERLQKSDFDFNLQDGESLNQTKKRMIEVMKNILMFEAGNKIAIVSHATALTCLLSAWCDTGRNYDNDIILSYKDETIIDGHWTAPMVFKVVFDGMNVLDIKCISLNQDEKK